MQTFKEYLTEAKGKGVTRDEAISLAKSVKSALRPEMTQPVQSNGPWWEFMIRDYEYFTGRPGEEDDDWPEFTGEASFMRKMKPVMKGIEWEFSPEEKDWVSIRVRAKKLSKAAIKKENKKLTKSVMDAVEGEAEEAESKFYRTFYTNLIPVLAKWKKKFITRDQFDDMTVKVRWNDPDAVESVWYMA